jgi:response regulator of citrate/malate metabolism
MTEDTIIEAVTENAAEIDVMLLTAAAGDINTIKTGAPPLITPGIR